MGMMREQKVIAAPGMRAEFSFGTSQAQILKSTL